LKHENLLSIYWGQLAEQFVGQELITINNLLFYWARAAKNSNAEIDFLLQQSGEFIPIEIKDGPAGKLRSLHSFRNTYQPNYSVVFYSGNTGKLANEKIIFLPLYYAKSFAMYGIDQI